MWGSPFFVRSPSKLDFIARPVDLQPSQGADFLAPGAGEDQQLDRRAHGPANLLRGMPHESNSSSLSTRLRRTSAPAWAGLPLDSLYDAAPDRPAKQPVQMRMATPGERNGATVGDRVDEFQDLAPADFGNADAPPGRQHLFVQDSLDLIVRAIAGLVAV